MTLYKRSVIFLCLAVSMLPMLHAQPARGNLPVMTRLMKVFTEHEGALMQAAQDKDTKTLDTLLAINFEMRMAHRAGVPVPRSDWIKAAAAHGAEYSISQMSVQEIGSVAVASFVLTPKTTQPGVATFVVDTWVPEGDAWKLRARHASVISTQAPKAAAMMGDAPQIIDQNKKY